MFCNRIAKFQSIPKKHFDPGNRALTSRSRNGLLKVESMSGPNKGSGSFCTPPLAGAQGRSIFADRAGIFDDPGRLDIDGQSLLIITKVSK
jgi:hypothetical protein